MKYLIILTILLIGCSTASVRSKTTDGKDFASSWDATRCQRTLDEMDALSWGLAFATGLTGVGGLSTAFPENDNTRLGLGISSAVLAAGASSIAVLLKSKRTQFSTWCNIEAPVAPVNALVEPLANNEKVPSEIPPMIEVYPDDGSSDAGVD